MTDYAALNQQLSALIHGVPHQTANLSNAAALLYHTLPDLNWAGFYLMEDGLLVLGPFQGKPACIRIQVGKGVCGTAVQERRTIRVEDVHKFPGHIACSSSSRSEVVVPLLHGGTIIGVLDIDSATCGTFDETDVRFLEQIATLVAGEEENVI